MKRRLIKVISLILLIFCQYLFADYPSGGFTEQTMLGRRPNARMEAMGKTAVASSGFLYAGVVNPACIGEIDNISLSYSIDPNSYYLLEENKWFSQYIGMGYNHNDISFSFDLYQKYLGSSSVGFENGEEIEISTKLELYSINTSYKINDDLFIGAAIRVPRWNLKPYKDWAGYLLDLGLLKKWELINNVNIKDNIDIGISVSNLFNQKIVTNSVENAPQNLRLGFSNHLNFKDLFIDQFITNFEVGHIFNSAYENNDNVFRLGFETSFWNVVLLRCGYYSEQRAKIGSNSKDYFSDFTYGIGLKVPTNIFHMDIMAPLDMTLDFVAMKQPTYITNYDSWDNFYNFSIAINWDFGQLK